MCGAALGLVCPFACPLFVVELLSVSGTSGNGIYFGLVIIRKVPSMPSQDV